MLHNFAYRFYGRILKFKVKIINFEIKMKYTQKFRKKICNFLRSGKKSTGKKRKEKKTKKGRGGLEVFFGPGEEKSSGFSLAKFSSKPKKSEE